jgi:hypothetical protein
LAAVVVGEMVDSTIRKVLHDDPEQLGCGVMERELLDAVMTYLTGGSSRGV